MAETFTSWEFSKAMMSKSETLFLARRYDDALEHARKQVARGYADTHQIGPALTIGKSLLLLGRYEEAQQQLRKLAVERHFMGSRVGSHFTYAGLADWFQGRGDQAIQLWEEGLKAAYQSQYGMEIPWVLMYATARDPKCYSRKLAIQLVKHCARQVPKDSSFYHITAYLLGTRSYGSVLKTVSAEYAAATLSSLRLLTLFRSLLDFFAGVHALFDKDQDGFYEKMLACASISGHDTTTPELLIAECELQRGPSKWKRHFHRWLRKNVHLAPVKVPRRPKTTKS